MIWYIHTIDFYRSIKRNKFLIYTIRQMILKNMLSKRSQIQKKQIQILGFMKFLIGKAMYIGKTIRPVVDWGRGWRGSWLQSWHEGTFSIFWCGDCCTSIHMCVCVCVYVKLIKCTFKTDALKLNVNLTSVEKCSNRLKTK